jgi:predicted secreted protein
MEIRPNKVLSAEHRGQIVDLEVGETFLIILPNPGAGGYVVQDSPEFDPQIIALKKMEKKPPMDRSREGDFGTIEWTFRARKQGVSPIVVRAFRPWEPLKSQITLFEVTIYVTE